MNSDELSRAVPEPRAIAARPEGGEDRPMSAFLEWLRRWLSCPELAKDFDPAAKDRARWDHARPRKPNWPEPKGRAPMIGDAKKVTVQTANNFCAVSFRIADYGLLREFSLRVWDYRIRLTYDDLTSYSWLFPPPAKS